MRDACDEACARANWCFGMVQCVVCHEEHCPFDLSEDNVCNDCAPDYYNDDEGENNKGDKK